MSADTPAVSEEVILMIDDDAAVLRSMDRVLQTEGFHHTRLCHDSRLVPELLERETVGIVLLDLSMPHLSGEELLGMLAERAPDAPVIVVTALDQVETAVRCMKAGAFDYLVKPVDFTRLVATLLRAADHRGLRVENRELRRRVASPHLHQPEIFSDVVTQSPAMFALFAYVEAIARSAEPALIVGETGVGKELIANALHRASGRPGDLVSVNVAALDDESFADTLFGHVKGAFTGALQERSGLVEKAADGTLFLDEIGDLRAETQTKLLRLIQEREYFALGEDEPRRSRCRVVTATNRDLRVLVRQGRFREDLYFRLHAHLVRVPPLRERMGDIPLLLRHFLTEAATMLGRPKPTPPRELITYLAGYAFPGNVRELRAMVMDAVTRHEKGVLSMVSFLEAMDRNPPPAAADLPPERGILFGRELPTVKTAMTLLFNEAMQRADGNQSAAARALGVSRRTINRFATSGIAGGDSDESPDPDIGTNP